MFNGYYCKSVQVFTQIFSTAAINKKGKTWIYDGKHANNRIEKLNRLILLWFYCIFFCHKMQAKFCFLSFYQNITFRFDKKIPVITLFNMLRLILFSYAENGINIFVRKIYIPDKPGIPHQQQSWRFNRAPGHGTVLF